MRLTVLLWSIAVSLLGCAAPVQTTSTGATANVIIIETDDAAGDAFQRMAQVVASEMYILEHSDSGIMTLSTEGKPILGDGTGLRLHVAVLGRAPTRVQLTGYFWGRGIGESRVEAVGQSGSIMKRAWDELERLAGLYPGARVAYERR